MANKPKPKQKRSGLGRGMDAIFTPLEETPSEFEQVEEISLEAIRPNPHQPRKHFNEDALNELADSIRNNGVFQPIIVRKSAIKGYELGAGERRVRASRLAGLTTIPAIVRQLDERVMIEIAVLENLQREDLSPLEEAEAYDMLMNKLNLTQAEVAERMGKSRPYIANYLRLLTLPDEVKKLVQKEALSMGQARTLLSLKDKKQLVTLAQRVIKEQLTVRQLEDLVQQLNEKSQAKQIKKTKKADKKPSYILACEQKLQERFGTMALIQQRGDKGKIEIEYMDESDLMRILDLLQIQA